MGSWVSRTARSFRTSLLYKREFFNIDDKFKGLIKAEFFFQNLSGKLEKWYEIDEKDFLKELNNSKVILSLAQRTGCLEYFHEQKLKIHNVSSKICKLDDEIDNAIYHLYGLTQQEIRLIESAFNS